MTDELQSDANEPELDAAAQTADQPEEDSARGDAPEDAVEAASEDTAEDTPESEEEEPEFTPTPRPPPKLERLQKILAQAGVASRRSAEAMITQGRVQVNGKVVTELGTKADAARDHIRVDGKLLHGAERLRYFMLNKPRGFVTTVKDPEGRSTVMQFFEKLPERLYPVGRLDYLSEGLLLVTNDGELANKLTKAASGVEKTYLVKVSGQPTEAELEILRGGVSIERGKPGSGQVRTSPARIRQVRQGDNPWYEVVLIEGRNRELRKMFEEVGHFVEKIRRVGYGPLVLDVEPGQLRELQPDELTALRLAAEGKLRTPKSKEVRRRNAMDAAGLPTVAPRPSRPRPAQPFAAKPFDRSAAAERPAELRPRKSFGAERPSRPTRPPGEGLRPAAGRTAARGPAKYGSTGPAAGPAKRPFRREEGEGSFAPRPSRPAWQKDARPPARFAPGAAGEGRSRADRPRTGGPEGAGRTGAAGRTFGAKPAWNKPADRGDRPAFKRPAAPRHEAPVRDHDEDLGPVRPPNLHIEEIQQTGSSSGARPSAPRSSYSRPPSAPRPYAGRPSPSRAGSDRPPRAGKPFRGEGGLERRFTTSSGVPRAGGARPSSKPGKPAKSGAGRSYGAGSSRGAAPRTGGARTGSGYRPASGSSDRPSRPYTPRTEGAPAARVPNTKKFAGASSRAAGPRGDSPRGERKTDAGWKPKTRYGGSGKPASGSGSRPKPGGFSKSGGPAKSGYKARPSGSGPKRTGPRPGGKKRS